MRFKTLTIVLVSALGLIEGGTWTAATADDDRRFEFAAPHMGTTFALKLYASSEEVAKTAAEAAFRRVRELDDRLSDYTPDSELRRLSSAAGTGQAVPVSDDLWRMLETSRKLSERTDGAFDVTAGPFVRLWRHARRTGKMPTRKRRSRAAKAVGYRHMRLIANRQAVELLQPNMRLDLGGIAKGFAADEAIRVLRARGIASALVDAGGDIAIGDAPPGKCGWSIAVARLEPDAPPSRTLLLTRCGVATSGDAFQYAEIDGTRYSHIIDPRTGLGVTVPSSVTVIAPTGETADALASAISVLGPDRGIRLADETQDVVAVIVRREEGVVRSYESARLPAVGLVFGEDFSPHSSQSSQR